MLNWIAYVVRSSILSLIYFNGAYWFNEGSMVFFSRLSAVTPFLPMSSFTQSLFIFSLAYSTPLPTYIMQANIRTLSLKFKAYIVYSLNYVCWNWRNGLSKCLYCILTLTFINVQNKLVFPLCFGILDNSMQILVCHKFSFSFNATDITITPMG